MVLKGLELFMQVDERLLELVRIDIAQIAQEGDDALLNQVKLVHLQEKFVGRFDQGLQVLIQPGLIVRHQVQDSGEAKKVLAHDQLLVSDDLVEIEDAFLVA